MTIEERYILSHVSFIPVDSVHASVKSKFEYEKNDIILTHLSNRNSSKVIDRDVAALLKQFESPTTFAEGIFNFSMENRKDPEMVADQVFGLLMEMKMEEFLVPYLEKSQSNLEEFLKINDRFKDYTIKEKCQTYDDSEVYKVEGDGGKMYAIKFLRTGEQNFERYLFENESEILRRLDGKVNPKLIDMGTEGGFSYIITDWIESVTCESEAMKYRNFNISSNVVSMLDLCVNILHAYHHLNNQGVLHGDINSGNILISPASGVKIVDYGYSSTTGADKRLVRGGVGFHFEPEYVLSIEEERESSQPTEKGEQYSIATLLYLLISGHTYLNFSYERDKTHQQILQEKPQSFCVFDLNLPGELDEVFSIALSKDPDKRFTSLLDFADAIIEVRDHIYGKNDYYVCNKVNSEEQFIEFLIRKFGWNSSLIENGLNLPPTCSVNLGAAGIAYMFYRMACVQGDSSLLDVADIWACHATNFSTNYDRSFYSPDLDVTVSSVGNRSIYHSPTGAYIVQGMISHCKGDIYSLNEALNGFLTYSKVSDDQIDLALGKSGLLLGCSIFLNELQAIPSFNAHLLTSFGNELLGEIWYELDEYPSLREPNPINYFGMAHGWAGILYATLMWCRASQQNLPKIFMQRVEQLLSCRVQKKNFVYWPVTPLEKTPWTGWCHGSAGHSFLWTLLYKHFEDQTFLDIAEQTTKHFLQDIHNSNGSLCCGMAGQSYALLGLFNLTGNEIYLKEAKNIKHQLLDNISSPVLKNNSLYKGEVGIGVLLCEWQKPAFAKMPLFE